MHLAILEGHTLPGGRRTCTTITTIFLQDLKLCSCALIKEPLDNRLNWLTWILWENLTCPLRYTYVEFKSMLLTVKIKNERTVNICHVLAQKQMKYMTLNKWSLIIIPNSQKGKRIDCFTINYNQIKDFSNRLLKTNTQTHKQIRSFWQKDKMQTKKKQGDKLNTKADGRKKTKDFQITATASVLRNSHLHFWDYKWNSRARAERYF